jgi:hypothetical protein
MKTQSPSKPLKAKKAVKKKPPSSSSREMYSESEKFGTDTTAVVNDLMNNHKVYAKIKDICAMLDVPESIVSYKLQYQPMKVLEEIETKLEERLKKWSKEKVRK